MTNKSTIRAMRAQRKKPKFRRPESWKLKRLKASWRRPRGIDNKIRQQKKGYPPKVKTGYRSPSESRGLHPSGFAEVIVYSPQELTLVDRKTQIVTIASTIGVRKKTQILERAREWAIRVTNPGLGPRALEEELELEFSEEELEALEELEGLEEDE
ncbi:MAG: 50S ribosomal protein L32e [Candidatus Hodarchaeota archaeon]